MELKDYIDKGTVVATSQKELAERIGVSAGNLASAKCGERGLPGYACIKLAQLVGAEPLQVIAASELATEKKADRRAVWLSFLKPSTSRGAKKHAHHVP